ncbi:uncharacterized protein LY89DRAFT_763921 [Mollisia scopiformis]|uniref:Zn(2)-C6 fungal-type domain-containing protein n=1 Tax=Mollisia scopiformis TaxID=149040 RepID=A0A132B9Y4_MOLSC|nr:uncharacterized protein LY89DRAFT_763921 [Mollisia scopiformis]KUJ09191.1 hypothetical protein LY89DRAFT_763921 [Mollisia scopiformis]
MATLARTACRRCREQKVAHQAYGMELRCSRELPKCDRCSRLNAVCNFPAPPDRKLLAASRAQSRKNRNREPCINSNDQENLLVPLSSPTYEEDKDSSFVVGKTEPSKVLQISVPVQTLLQDVYFSCMFNSTLVFHRPTFSNALKTGCVSRHVLLAVYASATIFLHPTSSIAIRNSKLLQPLGDIRSLGRQWAIQAGKEVLQDIDQSTFESAQTCIAYKVACTLGLDINQPSLPSTSASSITGAIPRWLDAEVARRCFWAVWFTQLVNSDHRLVGTSYDDQIMNLPLPLGDVTSTEDIEHSSVTLSDILNQRPKLPFKKPASPSIMAELMVLVLNWAKIRDLVRTANTTPVKDWLADLFELEGRLSSWLAALPETFLYSKRKLYEQLVVNQQPVYIFVHALYHQCRLVLHISLVPHFSGLHFHKKFPVEITSLSARIALKSAQAISELGADLLALDWDAAQIPSFVGYCFYVSSSIQITLLGSKDTSLAASARTNLISNLKLINSMKVYWKNLERLWARVNVLYEAQIARDRARINEGLEVSQDSLSDLDRLASEKRDTGQLAEALADSVMDYTLRRLKPDVKVDNAAAQGLDKVSYPNNLSKLMEENSGPVEQISSTAQARLDDQIPQPRLNQASSGDGDIPYTSMSWAQMSIASTSTPLLQSDDSYDWWKLGLDDLQQPILSYDELFSLDFGA